MVKGGLTLHLADTVRSQMPPGRLTGGLLLWRHAVARTRLALRATPLA